MARPKKGALAQFLIPIRSSSDGSIASTVTASDFNSGATVRYWGVNHGTSDASTSGAVSKTASLARSGVFRITLKGTENNYDEMELRINKTGLKEHIVAWNNADYDDSDLMSRLSDVGSDLRSYLVALSAELSNVESQVDLIPTVNNSDAISDIFALLSDLDSNFQSRVPKAVATNSQLSDLHSDLRSYLVAMSAHLSNVESQLSNAHSDIISAVGNVSVTITASDISDIASAVAAAVGSNISDIYSLLSDLNSNFLSRIPKEPAARSQLSDIGSDLRSYLVALSGELSNVESQVDLIPTTNNSDAISDIFALLSDFESNFQSRIPKEPAARSQVSDLSSDLRSYLVGISGAISDVESQLDLVPTVNNSDAISDIYALLSDFESNFNSRIPKEPAARSQLSDIGSDLRSYLVGISGAVSDVESQLDLVPTTNNSDAISNVYSLLSDLHSDVTAYLGSTGEPGQGAPPATADRGTKIDYLYKAWRNKKTQSSSEQKLFADDATTVDQKASVSDDGTTLTVGEVATGP